MKTLFEIQIAELNKREKKTTIEGFLVKIVLMALVFSLIGKVFLSFGINI